MKIVLFVEGHTEKKALPEFFKRWLDPRLSQPVGIKVVRFEGWAEYNDDIEKKVALHLSGKSGADVMMALGLLDLYGPQIYPNHLQSAVERYTWAKAHFEGRVKHPKFVQHFATHETEAWLLSDPRIFPKVIAEAFPPRIAKPETVNFNEPPAKLLERLYREKLRRTYRKTIDGANLFAHLAPDIAIAKCPYLGEMLNDALKMASGAGE
jgi:hypothetical protein